MIAPATANVIAKLAHGLADDMLTTTFLACGCTKIICPAMNTGMLENPATQENLQLLEARGMRIVEAASGLLACGDVGKGRLAPLAMIEDEIEQALIKEKPLARIEGSGHCRPNPGGFGSGPVSDESFQWKNGICDCQSCAKLGREGYVSSWPDGFACFARSGGPAGDFRSVNG